MSTRNRAGLRARQQHGFLYANRYLIARRLAQAGFLALFLSGPLLGVWIAKGTLASSMTLEILPLTDPFIALQSFFAGHALESSVLIGALIVLIGYLIAGGRSYCAWVCPVNPITDFAAWLRNRLGLPKSQAPDRRLRYALAIGILAVSFITGSLAWELINPVTALHRALVFGGGFGLALAVAIFLFDLFVAPHGWCGHLCPVGAFYGALGEISLTRVSAAGRARCDDCLDCFAVCPEPQVISPALRGERNGTGPLILSGACLNCGRCLDVCSENVFHFTHRFNDGLERPHGAKEAAGPSEKGV